MLRLWGSECDCEEGSAPAEPQGARMRLSEASCWLFRCCPSASAALLLWQSANDHQSSILLHGDLLNTPRHNLRPPAGHKPGVAQCQATPAYVPDLLCPHAPPRTSPHDAPHHLWGRIKLEDEGGPVRSSSRRSRLRAPSSSRSSSRGSSFRALRASRASKPRGGPWGTRHAGWAASPMPATRQVCCC